MILSQSWSSEVRNQDVVIPLQAVGQNPFLVISSFRQLSMLLDLWPQIHHSNPHLRSHRASLCVCSVYLLQGHLLVGFRSHLDNPGWSYFKILNLIVICKNHFPRSSNIHRLLEPDVNIFWGAISQLVSQLTKTTRYLTNQKQ